MSVTGFAFGGDGVDPPAQAEQLRKRIVELESQLADARSQLEALDEPPNPGATPDAGTDVVVPGSPPPTPGAAALSSGQAPGDPGAVAAERRAMPAWLRGWKSRVEVGLNGGEGNTSRQSIRFALTTDRKTARNETHLGGSFRLTAHEGTRSENRLVLDGRNDWILGAESPLRYFVTGTMEFDEFQAWDARASGFGGIGYEVIKDDKTTLLGRGGFGGSHRFGGVNDEFRAEAFVAADLTHKLSDAQKLSAGVEYLPDADGWQDYRLNADASWELRIDPESELFVRVGVATRFDSDPGSAKSADLDYFVNLGWTF